MMKNHGIEIPHSYVITVISALQPGDYKVDGGRLFVDTLTSPPLKSEGGWYIEDFFGRVISFVPD